MGSLSERLLKFSFVVKNGYNKKLEIHSAPVSAIRNVIFGIHSGVRSFTGINLNHERALLMKKPSLHTKWH